VRRWSEPGGEIDAGAGGEFGVTLGGTTLGKRSWYVTKMVQDWVSGRRPNHGLLVRADSAANGGTFASSEATTAANRPYLDVLYTERTGARRGYQIETEQLSDRISLGVNVANGNLMLDQSDLRLPGGLGPDVAVSRTYNSATTDDGATGEGWTLNTGQDVWLWMRGSAPNREYVPYKGPGGLFVSYLKKPDGTWSTPPGVDQDLTKQAGHTWTLTDRGSQAKQLFNADGELTAYEDRNGRRVSVSYWSGGELRIHKLTDANGDAVAFDYGPTGPEELTRVTDPAGRQSLYGYDAHKRLISFTDPGGGITRYEYGGPRARLSKVITPGGRITLIGYYPDGHEHAGRVQSITRVTDEQAMSGPTRTFEYEVRKDGSGETEVTDPVGTASTDANDRIWRHVFDDQARVTRTVDPLGRETTRKLTSTSKVESYTSAGNTGTTPNTSFTYDSDDNPAGSTTPAGAGAITTSADFGARDPNSTEPASYTGVPASVQGGRFLPGVATNEQGGRTLFSWRDSDGADDNGNLHGVQRVDDQGDIVSSTSMTWGTGADGKNGQLDAIRDGRGNVTGYEYDAKGNIARIVPPAPLGDTNLVYNDQLARVEHVQDGQDRWRVLSYDDLDRVTRIAFTGADTIEQAGEPYVAYTYDKDGNQLTETSREPGTGTVRTRTMTYHRE